MICDDCCTGESCEDPGVARSLTAYMWASSLGTSCLCLHPYYIVSQLLLSVPEDYYFFSLEKHISVGIFWLKVLPDKSSLMSLGSTHRGTRIPLDITEGFWAQWETLTPPSEGSLDTHHLLWNLEKWCLGLKNRSGEVRENSVFFQIRQCLLDHKITGDVVCLFVYVFVFFPQSFIQLLGGSSEQSPSHLFLPWRGRQH